LVTFFFVLFWDCTNVRARVCVDSERELFIKDG
jgi:hypothetical protein